MKYNNLILDCHNLFFRAYAVQEKLNRENPTAMPEKEILTKTITQCVSMIKRYGSQFLIPEGTYYFLFDNPLSKVKERKLIDPSYKSTREQLPKGFFKAVDYFELLLKNYIPNGYIIREVSMEADDWVLPLIRSLPEIHTSLLVSTDFDWARCVSKTVSWFEPRKNVIYDMEKFEEEYLFAPSIQSVCFFKTFYGDESDCIAPALRNFPFFLFKRVIADCGNAHDFILKALDRKLSYLDKGWIDRVRLERDNIVRNWKLVSFIELSVNTMKSVTVKCKFEEMKLSLFLNSLGIKPQDIDERYNKKGEIDELQFFMQGDSMPRK